MGVDKQYRARMRSSSMGTVIGIALVLFMLGILGYFILNARAVEHWVKENVRVEIFLKHGMKEVEVMQFRKELDTQAFARETQYVTGEEAAERLKADLGEDFLGVLGYNPLLASIELKLQATYAQPDSMAWIIGHLQEDPRIEEVKYNKDVVDNIDANMQKLGVLLLGFTALLLIIAVGPDQQHDPPGHLQPPLPDPHHAPGGRHAMVHQAALPGTEPLAGTGRSRAGHRTAGGLRAHDRALRSRSP
jgi:cell division transport system permease protein